MKHFEHDVECSLLLLIAAQLIGFQNGRGIRNAFSIYVFMTFSLRIYDAQLNIHLLRNAAFSIGLYFYFKN